MKVGIFDSGIGGLTVLKELVRKYPNNNYFYFGDTYNLPYGEKKKEELANFSNKIIEFLLNKEVDIIIIACGTVSSSVYDNIKDKYKIPIIDVINPTINYIKNKKYNSVGLIGTSMTINSRVFSSKLNNIGVNVIESACVEFVNIIEENKQNTMECSLYIEKYLDKIKNNEIQALIFGCTHYPLLEKQIKEYFKKDIEYINLGKVIANEIVLNGNENLSINLYFSKISDTLIKNVKNMIGEYEYEITEKKL